MPWIPVKHALRKLREVRGWSVQDLVDKTGLSDRQINALESRTPPSFVRPNTADVISAAFDLKLRDFNNWSAAERWIGWTPHAKTTAADADSPQVRQVGTLPKLAKRERDLGLHEMTVQTSEGPKDLLGLYRLHKVLTTPKAHDGQTFALTGKVDQHTGMPSSAARKI